MLLTNPNRFMNMRYDLSSSGSWCTNGKCCSCIGRPLALSFWLGYWRKVWLKRFWTHLEILQEWRTWFYMTFIVHRPRIHFRLWRCTDPLISILLRKPMISFSKSPLSLPSRFFFFFCFISLFPFQTCIYPFLAISIAYRTLSPKKNISQIVEKHAVYTFLALGVRLPYGFYFCVLNDSFFFLAYQPFRLQNVSL